MSPQVCSELGGVHKNSVVAVGKSWHFTSILIALSELSSIPRPHKFAACLSQVLAMSSRSWLSYSYQSRFHLTPLSYETLEFASGFASEQCPEGIVAISTNTLR